MNTNKGNKNSSSTEIELRARSQETLISSNKKKQPSCSSPLSVGGGRVQAPSPPIPIPPAPLVACSQHLLQPNGSISGSAVASAILPLFPDLLSAIPDSDRPCLCAVSPSVPPLTHTNIKDFLRHSGRQLRCELGLQRNDRVAVVLPNGPELALALLAVSCYCCVVPLNALCAPQELQADLQQAQVVHVLLLAPRKHENANSSMVQVCRALNIKCTGLVVGSSAGAGAGLFTLQAMDGNDNGTAATAATATGTTTASTTTALEDAIVPNQHDDTVLLLFTSGTTGSKKLVPHKLKDVLTGTCCIITSWQLTTSDCNCNLMPLFHVGGILRQVFSPVLSGGSVICCESFDAALFWQLLLDNTTPHCNDNVPQQQTLHQQQRFTWYYAAPTMHHVILQCRPKEAIVPKLRLICNAAGGLLPATARDLQTTFQCCVLPSYGMTECMPITSPPAATYQLGKPGTSGVAVGPEIAILSKHGGKPVGAGQLGAISVRGAPCFGGYVGERKRDPHEWFDTGDLGYMDADGYLYITGRSKEVINRGGEIISPMEVEECVSQHPAVLACVAFSTQHAVLQEVVGLLLVPASGRRIDLPALHEYLGQGRLAQPKWPQVLVYTDALPKSATNKLLRVKLGQRLSLPAINDGMYSIERTFQATCPRQGVSVSVAIPCERVSVSAQNVQTVLRAALNRSDLLVVPHGSKIGSLVCYVNRETDRLQVVKAAKQELHAYMVPRHVCFSNTLLSCDLLPPQPSDAIGAILQEETATGPADPLVLELQELVQQMLDLDCLPAASTNFFNLGGSSMLASQLASKIRKNHSVPFGGAEVFHASSCDAMAALIRERREGGGDGQNSESKNSASMTASSLFSLKLDMTKTPFEATRLESQLGYFGILFQLVPLLVIYPMWQLTRIFLFFRCLLWMLSTVPGEHNLYKFVLTLFVFHGLWVTFTPLLFVLLKWLIVGKYRKGRYPVWGSYYLRWWFCDVLRKLIGRGSWGAHSSLLNQYYRMLGASIGKDARISSQAEIAEFDLVTIGQGACVEFATVRGFGVDNGSIILGPVGVGSHASVGARSVVAPYTAIPDACHLGPVSSSYELSASASETMTNGAHHLRYNRQALQEPSLVSQLLVVTPLSFLCETISHLPGFFVLFWMLTMPWNSNEPFESVGDLVEWLANPRRIPFYIGIRVARAICAPFAYMVGAILVKWTVIGKFTPGLRNTDSEWQLIRHQLAATLFSRENMQDVTDLIGRHYELVSVLYRLLGAKVGKRVFWPGRQPVFTGEFDLLEIGDDVVFGSRASLFCTTVDSCEKIILASGSNVSDNTVVLPGSILGKGAVLGSNSLCPEGWYLPESSVWFGARSGQPVLLEKGVEDSDSPILASEVDPCKVQMDGDESTLRPFGRAFYDGEANYFIWPLFFINLFILVSRILLAALTTAPLLGAMHLAAGYLYGFPIYNRSYNLVPVSSSKLFAVVFCFYVLTHACHILVWLMIEVMSKWGFMGNRQEGRYNWDSSNYGQNWEFYQILSRVRELNRMNFLDFLCGTPFIVSFFRLLGCQIGNDCCLYPAGGDPYMPEPDLVEIGDRCVIDCASVVCHLNTRGNFELQKIRMQNNVTLRTRARIQQAVHMETGSMLLEKSTAMTGEVIEAESVWLGAPAARLLSYDTSSIGTRVSGSYAGSQQGVGGPEFV